MAADGCGFGRATGERVEARQLASSGLRMRDAVDSAWLTGQGAAPLPASVLRELPGIRGSGSAFPEDRMQD